MCGIIGIIGKSEVAPLLIDGLRRLEYRGYDSAGIATLVDGRIERRRAEGKLINLDRRVHEQPIAGTVGIGHTRWATHGGPTENNAHPHATDRVAVVHNGIIENYQELKAELEEHGHRFETETDTEIIVHLVTWYLHQGRSPVDASAAALKRLEGAFSLALIFAGEHELMIGARRGTPLAVGYGRGEMYLASDAFALAPLTNRLSYLEDGDWVVLNRDGAAIFDAEGRAVERPVRLSTVSGALIGKGEHRHFMLKEIYEQPQVIGDTLNAFVQSAAGQISLPDLPFDLAAVPRLTVVACGTAFYAGMVAKYWLEQVARIPVELDIASEFRYREAPMPRGGLALFISQSGETLDTLEALRYAKRQGQHILSVINVPESTIARESHAVLQTLAGPEIGVASTKAFTCQLVALHLLAIAIGQARVALGGERARRLISELEQIPVSIEKTLKLDDRIRELSAQIQHHRDFLYLGRGINYPIALEGALKLKEISYIHAEGYPAGEMKHGPIALIDEDLPVVAVAADDGVFEKALGNIQEAKARGARMIVVTNASKAAAFDGLLDPGRDVVLTVPDAHPLLLPILLVVPLQLLAYHVAICRGADVDQPRNLAKSVTVE
jgi:glucosamine--fructose-6-phosphate aminotransferase (isomerizing)